MAAAFIDLAKSVSQVHGVDIHGKVVVAKRRDAVLTFFANRASSAWRRVPGHITDTVGHSVRSVC